MARLTWLDALLAAVLAWGCWAVAAEYRESASRHRVFDSGPLETDAPPTPRSPVPITVQAADYATAADRLFSDRQRTAGSKPAVARPVADRVPVASLPVLFGIADLGDGPSALLASGPGRRARWLSPGESIGGYRLREIGETHLEFAAGGRRIVVTPGDLRAGRPGGSSRQPRAVDAGRRSGSVAGRLNTPARRATARTGYRIGTEFRPGRFAADASDGARDGTVFEGYVRRVRSTPFGEQNWWEKRQP